MLINNFSAGIKIDGMLAEEYQIQTDETGKKATCWIASELGKVEWRDQAFSTPTTGHVCIDGIGGNGSLITKPGSLGQGFRISETGRRPFVFSALRTTDDDSYLDTSLPNGLGEIQLTIWRVTLTGISTTFNTRKYKYKPVDQENVVHEKSKKALRHSTSLGESLPTKALSRMKAKRVGEPVATFCFRYRPLDVLQANGIAPPSATIKRPASPEVLEIEDSDEDEKELARLRAQAELVQARINSKRSSQSQPPKPKIEEKVKSEPLFPDVKLENVKTEMLMDRELIDLT
ncbi:hypothetical protein VKT23_004837 [Stygiomarasmius scandens]|uniref:DUF7918 domain-containing protein n=1 Tax=Marasmiellus scandens TaxID=2682957 RepID=A0ABR1JTY9_9AGAR